MSPYRQGENSRRSARNECDKPFRLHTASSNAYFPGRCINRGDDGFAGFVACELEAGQTVTIEFVPRGMDHPVRLQAKVVHSDLGAYGFEFVAPSDQQRTTIARLFEEM